MTRLRAHEDLAVTRAEYLSDQPPAPKAASPGTARHDALEDLLARLRPPDWHQLAACRGSGAFFPERGESLHEARQVCATCPVAEQCLAAGLHERFGVWGGTSERERRRIRAGKDPRPARDVSTITASAVAAGAHGRAAQSKARIERVRRARQLRNAGWHVAEIGDELGVHPRVVHRYLVETRPTSDQQAQSA